MLEHSQPRSLRACSRDDPECGARRFVLRRRLVTVRLGRQGPRPPGTTTWVRGARCNRSGANAGERSAAPGAQNRHGGAPRGERPASWRISTPYRSTQLHRADVPFCDTTIFRHRAILRFMELHSYITDTHRTPEPCMPKPRAAKLETATARRRLAPRKKPYWTRLSPGIALGYRRNAGAGTWSVRV